MCHVSGSLASTTLSLKLVKVSHPTKHYIFQDPKPTSRASEIVLDQLLLAKPSLANKLFKPARQLANKGWPAIVRPLGTTRHLPHQTTNYNITNTAPSITTVSASIYQTSHHHQASVMVQVLDCNKLPNPAPIVWDDSKFLSQKTIRVYQS